LQGFTGMIKTDAYEVYQSLERMESSIERIACLANARRLMGDNYIDRRSM